MPISATELLDNIKRRLSNRQPDAPLVAYWYCPDVPRKEFATAISAAAQEIVPLIVSGGFQVANQLTVDLSELIAANQTAFRNQPPPTSESPIILLLLSKDEFRLPQTASAACLPEWFPGLGGTEVSVWIEDLTKTATISWDHPDLQSAELQAAVYRLDHLVAFRLEETLKTEPKVSDPWFQLVKNVYKKAKPDTFSEAITSGIRTIREVTNSGKYRLALGIPSLTPLAAGVLLVGRSTPDQLTGIGKKFAEALRIDATPPDIHRTFTALLEETTNPSDKNDKAGRFGQTVLQAAYTAHRFYSVLAHTDQYPQYPFGLVRTVRDDVVRAISSAANAIEAHAQIAVPLSLQQKDEVT